MADTPLTVIGAVPHRRIGKLIVALRPDEVAELERLLV